MLHRMDMNEMFFVRSHKVKMISGLDDIHNDFVNNITRFGDIKNTSQKAYRFYEEALGYMREFERCGDELRELSEIFEKCVKKVSSTEETVEKYVGLMFESREKNVSHMSKYDAYLHNKKEYAENYKAWSDKNYNAGSVIAYGVNESWKQTENILASMFNTATGKNMATEVEVEYVKKVLHSAIQMECKTREARFIDGELEEEIVNGLYQGNDIIEYGMDVGELMIEGNLSDSQMEMISKRTGIGIKELGKFMEYGEAGAEYIEYLMTDYSKNMKYLQSIKTAFSEIANPVVVEQVISELERKYTKSFFEYADMAVEDAAKFISDEITEAITDLTPGTKALKLAADGVDFALNITGFTDNMDNWAEIVIYNNEFRPSMDEAIVNYLDKYNNGTATMQDIDTLNTLIDIDSSIKQIMYERMSVGNDSFSGDFANASQMIESSR